MSIHHIVEDAIASWPLLRYKHIHNRVPGLLKINTCAKKIKIILERLLLYASDFSDENPIQVDARVFHNLAVIKIRYCDDRKEQEIGRPLHEIEDWIHQMGGCLYVNSSQQNGTTLSVTFVCQQLSQNN